jgi:peptidoglycan hydrolase-like protein with peptidoglycan-binding domain
MDFIDLTNAQTTLVTGGQVDNLQGLLKAAARNNPSFDPGPIDGKGGSQTKNAVGAFQEAKAAPKDFKVGEKTWKALIQDKS